jgi:hypothetical protein
MSEQQGFLIRGGFVTACAFAIVVLFGLFYATVDGAVDRATQRHAEARDNARLSVAAGALPKASRLASLSSTTH